MAASRDVSLKPSLATDVARVLASIGSPPVYYERFHAAPAAYGNRPHADSNAETPESILAHCPLIVSALANLPADGAEDATPPRGAERDTGMQVLDGFAPATLRRVSVSDLTAEDDAVPDVIAVGVDAMQERHHAASVRVRHVEWNASRTCPDGAWDGRSSSIGTMMQVVSGQAARPPAPAARRDCTLKDLFRIL